MRRTILAVVAAVLVVTGCTATKARPEPSSTKWTQVWRDDFDGPAGSPPAAANWQHDVGTCYPGCPAPQWGTGEIETMTDSTDNVALDGGGRLAITPINTNGQWTSGRIETRRSDFGAPPRGVLRVEASLRQPAVSTVDGAGYWSAFWMLGEPIRTGKGQWPTDGEIDIMEAVNGRQTTFGSMHCGTLPDGPCREASGNLTSGEQPCPGCAGDFHTYAVEVDNSSQPQQIRWYLDDVQFYTLSADRVDAATWTRATDHGFFLILNVAIGGMFPKFLGGGPNAATASGRPMLVDHVAVYVRKG
jgi:beta-glucanase (GH16 family)